MWEKLKTADVRNIVCLIIAILFSTLAILERISPDNIMNVILIAMTYLFVKDKVGEKK